MSAEASSHAGEHLGEVAVVQLHRAGALAGHVAHELRDAGVAVDGDQAALGAELRGHGLGVTAGPERAVDGHLAAAGRSSSSSSSRRTGVWARAISYSSSRMLSCGSIGLLLQAGQVARPAGAVPDLEMVLRADDA